MGEPRDNDAYEEELLDYEEDEDKAPDSVPAKGTGETVKKGYVGIHSSGFRDFLLKPELLRAIVDSGFEHPSEGILSTDPEGLFILTEDSIAPNLFGSSSVQHECIPQAILGMDVICQAKSGMGKTAVFVLSALQQIEPVAGQVAALVLCHTRELAYQICHEFERFSTYLPDIKVAVFYGGVHIKTHKDILKNECPHIVVGTPGRILALTRDKDLTLKNVRHFILDECDKMLESLDMRRDVQEIFKMTPHDKQVMMFSATLSKEIRPVCKRFMQDPMEIYVDDEAKLTLHGLVQHYIKLGDLEKNRKLNDLLDALDFNQVVIFVKSVNRAAELNKLLVECNFPSICIHSGMSQEERLTRYKGFKEGHKRILVATDLVGRGIDIERVNIVINYDMPDSADTYLHRVGRAGRFGTKGLAITFVSSASDSDVLNQVQERFEVDIKELPEQIDTSTYTSSGSSNRLEAISSSNSFDVISYGAVGDGKTDDSQAFLRAWGDLCKAATGVPILTIPTGKTFLLNPVKFEGPCMSTSVHVQVLGNIVAPDMAAWTNFDKSAWLVFSKVNGLIMDGPGQIDGQGSTWWVHQACEFNELNVSNYILPGGPMPTTNGDDCVAINSGSSFINITGVTCGPGHGISVGSLGAKGGYATAEEIYVQHCTFSGTMNGARIKTWQGGSGYARKISFEQITLTAVKNPIIIDQYYCNGANQCTNSTSAVAISDVRYNGVQGTSSVDNAINLSCSHSVGCTNIVMDQINITSAVPGKQTSSYCLNAHGRSVYFSPVIPLKNCNGFIGSPL
ncbi:hypothetical protein HHK36_013947 [Tetracentron sinense]|uniref:RNA helicase n=1 Tax=Tetracentron sinense TaxID=13715 RepID=A0A835DEN6_TETSI|nr:hypothetical protein HHK36_013947 [Tetracentron sinense]